MKTTILIPRIENPQALLFWVVIGILLGLIYIYTQSKSVDFFTDGKNQRFLPLIFFFSIIRIITSGIILFFAFRQSVLYGIAGLLSFIATRWISLFKLLKDTRSKI